MSTKTIKLRKTLIILVSIALLLVPNLIVLADGPTGSDAQGTPTLEPTTEVSAEPTESQAPENSSEPTGDPSEEPTESPAPTPEGEVGEPTPSPSGEETTPPANAPEATQTGEAAEVTPSPDSSEEPTDTPAPTPSEEGSEPTPSPSGEATPIPAPKAAGMDINNNKTLSFEAATGLAHYTYSYDYFSYNPFDWGWKTVSGTKNAGESLTVDHHEDVTISAVAQSGYSFVKWKKPSEFNNSTQPSITIDMGSNKSAKAVFETVGPTMYTLDFNGSHCTYSIGDGNTYDGNDTVQIQEGTVVSVTAIPESGYYYTGWDSTPGTNANPTVFTMNGNKSVDAAVAEQDNDKLTLQTSTGHKEYQCDYYKWENGALAHKVETNISGEIRPAVGTEVKIRAVPLSTHLFKEWVNSSGIPEPNNDDLSFTMPNSDNKKVKAKYEEIPKYDIYFDGSHSGLDHYSYTLNGGAPVNINGGQSATFDPGDVVVVTAHAAPLYIFDRWDYDSGDVDPDSTSGNTATFTMDHDKTADARFTFNGYKLTCDFGGSIQSYTVEYGATTLTVTSNQPISLPKDVEVTVTANPSYGRVFDYWDSNCTPPTSGRNGNKWTFTMNQNHWLKAYGDQLSGEKFQVKYEDMLGTGSGNVKVYYPDNTYVTTLSEGQTAEIVYQSGKTKVKVEAVPSTGSNFVRWSNYGVTSPVMEIDLVTGQGSAAGMSVECHVAITIKLKPEFEKVGSLTITKVDQDNNSIKLAGARFKLKGTSLSYEQERTTGSNGVAKWEELHAGTYTLSEVSPPSGYKPITSTWTVVIGANGGITMDCVPPTPYKWNVSETIENEAEHCSLTVNKVDSQGATIAASATFKLTGPGGYSSEKQSSDGTFFWGDLVPGNYTLTEISAPSGYYWQTNPHNITLTAGQAGTKDVTNYEYAKVIVKKYDQDGAPLTGATFTLGGVTGTESPSGSGIYVWNEVKAGTYTLNETDVPDGYYISGSSSQNVTVNYGDEKVVEVTNYEYAKVTVKKYDQDGAPLTGATFTLGGVTGTESPSGSGIYVWDELEAGTYTLDETGIPDGYYITGNSSQNVTVEYGDDKVVEVTNYEYVSIQVQKKCKLTGTPLSGAEFKISAGGVDLPGTVFTGTNGIAKFEYPAFKLKAGVTYTVTEVNPPNGYLNDSNPITITVTEPGGINQLSGGIFENTPYLHSITVIKYFEESLVSNIGGGFLDGLEFELFMYDEGSWVSQGTKALSNGTCEFANLMPGDYKIVELGTGNAFAKYMTLDGDKEVTIEVVNQSTNTEVGFTNSYVDAAFTLVKLDSQNDNLALQGAIYHLKGMMWNGSSFEEHTYVLETDVYGIASVEGLTPGMYTLQEVQAPPHYDIDPTVYDIEILPGRSVEEFYFVENDKLAKLVLAKFQSGTNNQTRLINAVFSLYLGSEAPGNLISQQTTDPFGNIVWDNLRAGNYVLVEDSPPTGYTIVQRSYAITLDIGEEKEFVVYNDGITTPPPTPPTNPPETTPSPSPSPSPTPVPTATPTPVNTEEITIEDVDPAFGPETGEGNGLFMTVGILLLMASALFIIRKKTVLKSK